VDGILRHGQLAGLIRVARAGDPGFRVQDLRVLASPTDGAVRERSSWRWD
jgi:hypothetical protein